ncbi:hypothetical protein [Apilactobacillus micheneri]|uniref:hypothetical protein n=1 Tax=Apilactobacillus micheneri TaxID=1899430 RepID=UPI000D03F78C|nr:hypothetical protein [Apilactobacillus micheneri]
MADNTDQKVEPLSPVEVTNNYNQANTPYGLNGVAIFHESDHEQVQSYRDMEAVEQDYGIDSDVWKQANSYFTGLNASNGLVQVISFNKNYGNSTGGPIVTPPGGTNNTDDKKGDVK